VKFAFQDAHESVSGNKTSGGEPIVLMRQTSSSGSLRQPSYVSYERQRCARLRGDRGRTGVARPDADDEAAVSREI
jgi:hypothetical protein